jgi:hypothetical protein
VRFSEPDWSTWPELPPIEDVPGADLLRQGNADLEKGIESVEALLVSIGWARLTAAGVELSPPLSRPENRLYDLLAAESPDSAHGRYNALIRRLVSLERAAEAEASARA